MTSTISLSSTVDAQTVESKPSKSQRFYRPELDAIRFFLFLGVLFHHSIDNSGAQSWAKVPLLAPVIQHAYNASSFALSFFFFLSSYLITCLLQIEKQRTGTLSLKRFYIRRMLRLWPLYMGYLALVCVLHFLVHGYPVSPGAIAALLLFAGNWYLIFHGPFPGIVLFHLWSISVEEQFYVLFPFLAKKATRLRLQQGCAVICTLSLVSTWFIVHHGSSSFHTWTNSFTQSIFFASGAMFALRAPLGAKTKSATRAIAGTLTGLAFWIAAPSLAGTLHPFSATLAFAAGDLGCICMLWGVLQVPTRWLPPSLVYLGRIAYGLYVFHMLVISLVRHYFSTRVRIPGVALLLELCLCIVIASVSYEFFEKPFLKLKHRFELVHSRTA